MTYTKEELEQIIQILAPPGLIKWSEENNIPLTDPDILRKYRFYEDAERDYRTQVNAAKQRGAIKACREANLTKEETVEFLKKGLGMLPYAAEDMVKSHWED